MLDELTTWDRALNQTEIALIQEGVIDTGSTNLRLYLPFDEVAGSVAADRGPLGLDVDLALEPGLTETYFDGTFNDSNFEPIEPSENPDSILHLDPVQTAVLNEALSFNIGELDERNGTAGRNRFGAAFIGTFRVGAVGSGAALEAGPITFGTRSDDGSFIYIDADRDGLFAASEIVVDNGGTHGLRNRVGTETLAEGNYGIAIAYYQGTGGAGLTASFAQGTVPETEFSSMTVIDSSDPSQADLFFAKERPVFTSEVPAGLNPDFVFDDQGQYTLTVIAHDGDGGIDRSVTTIDVGNVAPTINDLNAGAVTPAIGQLIELDARDVTDPGVNDTFDYRWDVTTNNGQEILSSDGIEFEFTPQYAGEYTVTLTVFDRDGGVSSQSQLFDVAPTARIDQADDTPALTGTQGEVVQLTSADSSPVAPAGLLRGTGDAVTREYLWTVTAPDSTQTQFTTADLQFVPLQAGNHSITLQITDSSTSQPHTSDPFVLIADTVNAISIVGANSATEGDVLTFSLAGLPEIGELDVRSVAWSVTGGAPFETIDVADPELFQIRLTGEGTHTINAVVTDNARLSDGSLGPDFVPVVPAIDVTTSDVAPTIIASDVTGFENSSITLNLSVLDPGTNDTHTYVVNWGDGSPDSTGMVSAPLLLDHTYLQDSGMLPGGVYAISITVTDVNDASATQTVTVDATIANVAPVAVDDSLVTMFFPTLNLVERPLTDLTDNDIDPGTLDDVSVVSIDAFSAKGAAITIVGTDFVYDASQAPEILAVDFFESTTDSFRYVIEDSSGVQSVGLATFLVTEVLNAPVAPSDSVSIDENSATVADNVLTNDFLYEPGLGLLLRSVNGEQDPAIDIAGVYGTLDWGSDGAVSYTLNNANEAVQQLIAGQSLVEVFTYESIADSSDTADIAESELTITINGTNDAPVAVTDISAVDADARLTVPAAVGVTSNDSDVDGTFVLTAVNDDPARIGVQFELPSGALLRVKPDGEYDYEPNGAFDYLPSAATADDTFTYTITDDAGASDTATVTITVTGQNEAPSAVTLSDNTTIDSATDGTVVGVLTTLDIDTGDTNMVAIDPNMDGEDRFDVVGGNLVVSRDLGAADVGDYVIKVTATDGLGASIDQAFSVIVTAAPVDPTLNVSLPVASSTDLTVRRNGGNLEVFDNTNATTLISQPIDATTSLTISGAENVDETVTLDYDFGGYFDLTGSIVFNAGDGGNDHLIIQGGAETDAYYQSNNTTLGNATIEVSENADSMLVHFTGVEPLSLLDIRQLSFIDDLNVGGETLTLRSPNPVNLPAMTNFMGGTISSTGSGVLTLGNGEVLQGNGAVEGAFAGELGSSITADGALTIGDATSNIGFATDGQLDVGDNTVTLLDANQAALGAQTLLGSGGFAGVLEAVNGFLVDSGNNVTGFGTLDSTNDLALHSLINGSVNGNSSTEPITLSGYTKGIGSLNNVQISGTHSPGLSPAQTINGSVSYADTAELLLEVGGTTPGSAPLAGGAGHDQMVHTGSVELDGDLMIELINGYTPSIGDTMVLMTASDGITGSFDNVSLPAAPIGSTWDLVVDSNDVRLSLVGVENPSEVLSTAFGDGTNQRSNITQVEVTFEGPVDIAADAFTITQRESGTAVSNTFATSVDGSGNTVATIVFDAASSLTRGVQNALADGNYELRIDAAKVLRSGTTVQLDGNGNGMPGGQYLKGDQEADAFFAHFGDTDGDRDVDGQDYGRFGLTFLKASGDPQYSPDLDSDGDGDVDGQDYGRFGLRFLKSLPF